MFLPRRLDVMFQHLLCNSHLHVQQTNLVEPASVHGRVYILIDNIIDL